MGVPPWKILQHSDLVRQEGGWMLGASSLRPPRPMPVAWRRRGELLKPELSEHHQLRSLLCHPLVCSWGLSHPLSPPTTLDARRQPNSDPPTMTWRFFGLAKAEWALTTSLTAPGVLAVLWAGGLQLLIWGGKHSREVRGRAGSCYTNPPGRQAEGCESIRLSE